MSAPAGLDGAREAARRARARRSSSLRLDLPQTVLACAYVLVALGLACALAWPIYRTPLLIGVAAYAGVVGVGSAIAARMLRWPLWLHLVAVAGAYLVGVVPLAVPAALSSPTGVLRGLLDGVTGIVLGWKQLLTLDLPVGQYQAVLVPVYALFLIGAALAAGLALSPGRRAAVAVPVTLVMGVFGIAFGPTDPGAPLLVAGIRIDAPREVLLGLLLVAVSLLWLSLRSRLRRRAALAAARGTVGVVRQGSASTAAAVRRRLLGAALIVVALVAGFTAGPALAGVSTRETLRTATEPLLVVQQQTTPLGRYRASFEKDAYDRVMFTVSGADASIDRLRMATLDDWDGEHFLVSGDARFSRLPGGSPAASARALTVTIGEGYSGIWLPMPSDARTAPSFSGSRAAALADAFYLDKQTGAGIDVAPEPDGARGVRAGDRYQVQGTGTPRVALADPGSSSLLDLTQHPQLAAWVKAQQQPRTAAGFEELVKRLRDRGYLSHSLAEDDQASAWISALRRQSAYPFESSFAGHSTARVEELFSQLLEQQDRVGSASSADMLVAGVGDDEQFAAAGALLARAVGYESRVVVGVRMGAGETGGIPDCSGECTGANLAAWIEVRAPGAADWTTVDVEPQFTKAPTLISLDHELPKNPTVPEQPQVGTVLPPAAQHDDRDATRAVVTEQPEWVVVLLRVLTIVGLAVVTLLLLTLPFLVVLVAKRTRRRRRRRAPVPEVAVVGAWAELMDARTDIGEAASTGTRRDAAAAMDSATAVELAALVDIAVFAEHPPTRDAADRAWELVDTERARLRAEHGPVRSLLAALNPASFVRALGRPRPVSSWLAFATPRSRKAGA
ncbi:hypothetical protein IT072_05505 [Leifsonia sp. ZF2019]|uniref:transglutaminase domain-containing protein n=1 Tax=Leifsonia sp. ZF2019 TaxID=2781978 RepID=UPI001CBE7C16|nr:transglutaminase domain-containing protein [Leifsonia sp. ZF2019]UAJ80482.1 hypothetical protein IT072_05505 [Leifsonia sp. ZF2019]